MLDGLLAITDPVPGAEFVSPTGERIIGIDLPADAPWPLGLHPVVAYYQPELEAFFRDSAVTGGVDLRLGVEVTAVAQDTDGVTAEVVHPDGSTETLRAGWLIAADGASSPIRKSLGIAFEDQGFDQDWLVVDVELTADGDAGLPTHVRQICDPARPVTFVPGHARYRRWEFQLQPGETRDEMSTDARVWDLLRPWLGPDQARLVRAVVYRFHATVAATMRSGRIFLAGDAAHQMPPFLGQGLCAGVRDAANLSWKLAAVRDGRAGDALLDSYDIERRPHAAGVVAHAVDTGRLIDTLSGRAGESPDLDSAYGGQRPFPHLTSGVLAGDHPLVGRQAPQPRLDGVLLDESLGDGWALLLGPEADAAAPEVTTWAGRGARIVRLPEGAAPDVLLPPTGVMVVRPDRYIAAVASTAADLGPLTAELTITMGAPT